MARPLRIEQAGGRFHAIARGNERRHIYRDDSDRFHFLELLSEMPEPFGVRLHAYVLMDNHFHLLVETPEANLRRSMQCLRVKERELRQARELSRPVSWNQILGALELRGETWESFGGRYPDWGRDPPLWLGRRQGRLGLAALGALPGGLDYAAVSVAVRRFAEHLKQQPAVQQTMATVEKKLVGC